MSSIKDLKTIEKAKATEKIVASQAKVSKKDLNPQTLKIYNNISKRIWFQRRPSMLNKNMLILVFDGLMGAFRMSDDSEAQFFARQGLIKGL